MEPEARRYAAHLAVCPPCRAELALYEEVVAHLELSVPVFDPPESLLVRLKKLAREMASIGSAPRLQQPWKRWKPDKPAAGLVFSPARGVDWEPTQVEGVEVRRLYVDDENDRVTMLIRMAPGASYPGHVHGGGEECYVIEGDLEVGDLKMAAGDYQYAPPGSRHGVQSTRNGCKLFIVSSLSDEIAV